MSEICLYENLTNKILCELLLKLEVNDILNVIATSEYFYKFCDDEFWKKYVQIKLPNLLSTVDTDNTIHYLTILKQHYDKKTIKIRISNPHCHNVLTEPFTITKYSTIKSVMTSLPYRIDQIKLIGKHMKININEEGIFVMKFTNGPCFILDDVVKFGDPIKQISCSIFEIVDEINIHKC